MTMNDTENSQQANDPVLANPHGSDALADAINDEWQRLYGGDKATTVEQLVLRVRQIAADRDCWVGNAKLNQKEYQRMEKRLNRSESARKSLSDAIDVLLAREEKFSIALHDSINRPRGVVPDSAEEVLRDQSMFCVPNASLMHGRTTNDD